MCLDQTFEGERVYAIKKYSFDLRMQVSLDGKDQLYGWYDYEHLLDTIRLGSDIVWEKCLEDKLGEEKWLFRDLWKCVGCYKYKPEQAFGRFDFEDEMVMNHGEEFEEWERDDCEWFTNKCKRCRAKELLVQLDGGKELFDNDGDEREGRDSLGLKLQGKDRKETEEERNSSFYRNRTIDSYDRLMGTYEKWEDIFVQLNV
jgi:hypothetical protein